MDGSRADAAQRDGGLPPACDPPCETGQSCIDGTCMEGVDLDGDGLLGDEDCDDLDAAIGHVSERACSSSCGTGVTRCADGVWGACTAPTTCDCEAGTPARMIPCMNCGLQRQVCDGGLWRDDGVCTGGGACSVGAREPGGACGNCGTQSRECMADCTWGPWDCTGGGTCVAGATETAMQPCGTCGNGTQSHTRTCSDTTCEFGAWGPFGACSGGEMGVCAPGQTETETGTCTGGCATRTRTRSCDTALGCDWGAWGGWSTCPTCGPVCGDGSCSGGETCSSCGADCRYGQGGSGTGGGSCAGVPAETWRCVTTSACGGPTSQVCRGGTWVNFNCAPRGCSSCFCSFSTSCCAVGSPSGGC